MTNGVGWVVRHVDDGESIPVEHTVFDQRVLQPRHDVVPVVPAHQHHGEVLDLAGLYERECLEQLVEDNWGTAQAWTSSDVVQAFRLTGNLGSFTPFENQEILDAIQAKRARDDGTHDEADGHAIDLKGPEWTAFSNPDDQPTTPDFSLRPTASPPRYASIVREVVLAESLREVSALIGFTRVEPPAERGTDDDDAPARAPLSDTDPTWVPASEMRGEGVFLRFDADRIASWLAKDDVRQRTALLLEGHVRWRAARRMSEDSTGFPGAVYVALHTLAHSLIREFSVDCGYGAASIRERVYASAPDGPTFMAGIMLYTAAPDSEGTLGGLVQLGSPENLDRLMGQALERAQLCSSDPLCSEHLPRADRSLHGAACHACLFAPETSCEAGNRYLDRALVVPTIGAQGLALFDNVS